MEEVVFKNETDLQQTLTTFLPPREVFTNTTFLMQESDNIFELTPAERISIFKNIFGLLDIDEAKEIIAEEKKNISALLKVKRNTDDVNSKLSRYLSQYLDITASQQHRISPEIASHAKDWEMLRDKITIESFDLASLPIGAWNTI